MISENEVLAHWNSRQTKQPTNISILQISNRTQISTVIVMEALIRSLSEQLDTYKQANSDLAIANNILQQTVDAQNTYIDSTKENMDVHYNSHNNGE